MERRVGARRPSPLERPLLATSIIASPDEKVNLVPTSEDPVGIDTPTAVPGRVSPTCTAETHTNHQRRFAGNMQRPHSTKWVAQRIHEDPTPSAVGFISSWVHPRQCLEATSATIAQINQLSDDDAEKALNELCQPKAYVQGTRGNKLQMDITLTTLDDVSVYSVKALLDSGCTGSTIHPPVHVVPL